MATARWRQTSAMVRRGGGKVDLGLDQVEQLFTLLIGNSILTARALALVRAEQTGSQTVAVELETASAPTVTRLVAG